MSNISYSKERRLSFDVIRIKLSDIPILIAEKLNIFQKYLILLLNEGIKAQSREELVDKISYALNIKRSFILEFIEILSTLSYIVCDDGVYHLSSNYKIIADDKDGTIMRANVGVKNADCDDIYYIPDLDKICDISYFEGNELVISKKNNTSNIDEKKIKNIMSVNNKELEKIVRKNLEDKNYVLCDNFSFSVSEILEYNMYVDTVFLYEYDGTSSKMKEIKYDEKLEIHKEIIYEKGKEFNEDDKLPRFIGIREEFYEKYNSNENNIEKLIDKEISSEIGIVEIENKIKNIEKDLSEEKKKLKKVDESDLDEIIRLNSMIEKLTLELSSNNEELKNTRIELNKVRHEKNMIQNEQDVLLNNNKKIMNPTISNVFNKFNKFGKLNTVVNIICSHLDIAISASECDSFDTLFESISQARSLYVNTFKAIFDVTFGVHEKSLAVYYDVMKYQTKIDKNIDNKIFNINRMVFSNIKKLHDLFAKDGHSQDIEKKSGFKKEDFKKLSKEERYNILISIIEFLNNLNLKENQLKEINTRLLEKNE